jgi:prepilin-type N-terminal cleavage/methylation domain-containing protein/prepilin-type processing-associated H-X9-DG protein
MIAHDRAPDGATFINEAGVMYKRDVQVRRRTGFTLIELLVVIGIIALLISILMPSVSRARLQAKMTQCAANLRNIGTAMSSYVTTNEGYYPGHAGLPSAGGQPMAVWPTRLRKHLSGDQNVFYCPSQEDGLRWQVKTGAGAGFASATDAAQYGYRPGELLLNVFTVPFSYGYNDWGAGNPQPRKSTDPPQRGLGGDLWNPNSPEVSTARVKKAAEMIAIADGTPDGVWDYNIDPLDAREAVGKIHFKGCNVAFADGHVAFFLQDDLMLVGVSKSSGKWNQVARLWNIDNQP